MLSRERESGARRSWGGVLLETARSQSVVEWTARRARAAYIACAAALTLLLLAVYGRGYAGYDAVWALIWGRNLAHGQLPDFDAVATAPTPHPLSNVAGALLSPFGDAALPAFQLVVFASAGALGVACYALGRHLFSAWLGVLFAAIVLTRAQIVGELLVGSVDIPFLALVVSAAALEAARPRRGVAVQVLLAVAGLLRPEAWLLSLGYALWLRPDRRALPRVAALAIAAPLFWMVFDLVVEGDALFSLHGTQALAATLERPRGLSHALSNAPSYLSSVVPPPLIWLGLAGWVAGMWLLYERLALPTAMALAGLATFLALGVTDLPVLNRYLLLPAVMLALFAAVALLGWTRVAGRRARLAWALAATAAALLVVLSVPDDRDEIDVVQTYAVETRRVQDALHDLAAKVPGADCEPVRVAHFRMRPLLAYWLDVPPAAIADTTVGAGGAGLFVTPASADTVAAFFFGAPPAASPSLTPPRGMQVVAHNAHWILNARCGSR